MIQPGPLSFDEAKALSRALAELNALKRSAGTGDGNFSVGTQGISSNVESPETAIILCNTDTPTSDGRYDAIHTVFDEVNTQILQLEECWLRECNDNTLTNGRYYLAHATNGNEGRTVWTTQYPPFDAYISSVSINDCLLTVSFVQTSLPDALDALGGITGNF